MSRFYTETEVITLVDELDETRLQMFLKAQVVTPVATHEGKGYREADLARLALLCDLVDCYEMPADGLTLVMSLLDQLNTARGDMRALMQAVAAEPDEVRQRIHRLIREMRG
jgi:chaperone modulatory protein CbpM